MLSIGLLLNPTKKVQEPETFYLLKSKIKRSVTE